MEGRQGPYPRRVRGEFRQFDGALEIGENLAASRAYGRVDATSVDTNQARRDKHLRVIGDLSINGVTNEVQLTAEPSGIETGPEGEERIGLEVTGQVSRTAFAMTFLAALGSAVVADKVKSSSTSQPSKRPSPPPPSVDSQEEHPMSHRQTESPRAPAPPRWDDLETVDWRGIELLWGRKP
jgi:polyisoprenoid-binding protein YceI